MARSDLTNAAASNDSLVNPPDGEWVVLRDGFQVYTRTWRPRNDDCGEDAAPQEEEEIAPRAALTFVHGIGEHITRYDHMFSAFARAGISVHAWDQRGFGRTVKRNGKRGHNDGWDTVLADVKEALERHRSMIPGGIPHFLGGHSMGGLIVLDYLRLHGAKEGLAGVFSTSPAIGTDPRAIPPAPVVSVLRVVKRALPTMVIKNALPEAGLARSDVVIRDYKEDPLNHPYVSLTTGEALISKGEFYRSPAAAKDFPSNVPLLLVHGTDDPLTNAPDTQKFWERAVHIKDRTLKLFHGGLHELHNEPMFQDDHYGLLLEWMVARMNTTGAPTAGSGVPLKGKKAASATATSPVRAIAAKTVTSH